MKIRWWFIGLPFLLLACNLGPLLVEATATPSATATQMPTLTPTLTETPTATSTAYIIPTQTTGPTAITCPKGTELDTSTNRCFYATRTPKPQEIICHDYAGKAGCANHGCSWDAKSGTCS